MKRGLTLLFLLVFAASTRNIAQNVYEFLRLDMSPRAAALAGSFVANNDDANVIFYNPAGFATLEDKPVSFSFVNHLVDIKSASLSYSMEVGDLGRFAAGVQYINYGSFTEADEFGNRGDDFSVGDVAFVVGYANQLDENFYYGVNTKFIYSSIAEYSSSGLAADIGLQYVIPSSQLVIGLSALNMGGQLSTYINSKESLPLDVRIGVSKGLEKVPLKFYLSLNKLNEKYDSFSDRLNPFTVGAELNLSKSFVVRLGYDNEKKKELKIGNAGGIAGFSLGVGLNISGYVVDYGYSSLGAIGSIHRFGLSTAFN